MRIASIDALRGTALAAMIAYHGAWDLTYFGYVQFDLLHDPFWLAVRTGIVAMFLLISGACLVLAQPDWRRAGRRAAILALAAVGISAATLMAMPESPILFGILHLLALSGLLGRPFLKLPVLVPAGVAALLLAAATLPGYAALESPWLLWLGLGAQIPAAVDYVPVVPWFALILGGLVLARLAARCTALLPLLSRLGAWQPRSGAARLLTQAGRYSLPVYLLHQPLLFGALLLAVQVTGRPSASPDIPGPARPPAVVTLPPGAQGFLGSCQVSCEKSGATMTRCAGYCRCVASDLYTRALWRPFQENHLSPAQKEQLGAIIQGCAGR